MTALRNQQFAPLLAHPDDGHRFAAAALSGASAHVHAHYLQVLRNTLRPVIQTLEDVEAAQLDALRAEYWAAPQWRQDQLDQRIYADAARSQGSAWFTHVRWRECEHFPLLAEAFREWRGTVTHLAILASV